MHSSVSGVVRNVLLALAFSGLGVTLFAQDSDAALVRRRPVLNGTLDGSLRVLSPDPITLNSGGVITQDLFVPGTPMVILNGTGRIGTTVEGTGLATPTGWKVTLNSGASVGRLVTRDAGAAMTTVSAPPPSAGTKDVAINTPSQEIGDFTQLRNLTLNSDVGARIIPPGTYGAFTANRGSAFVLGQAGSDHRSVYHLQRLTLNSGSELRVVGPVEIVVANAVSLNAPMGNASNPDWLECSIASGGLTLNSPARFAGYVTAPAGAVVVNGPATLTGGVRSDSLTLNSGSRLTVVGRTRPVPVPAILSPVHAAVLPTGVEQSVRVENTGGPAPFGLELWVDGQSLGSTAVNPGLIRWLPSGYGVRRLQAVAPMPSGPPVASAGVDVRLADALPFEASFEVAEGFSPGPIHGQRGWEGAGDLVTSSGGGAVVRMPADAALSTAGVYFAADETAPIRFAGVMARPIAAATPEAGVVLEFAGARLALVQSAIAGQGEWFVFADSETPGEAGVWRRIDQPSPVALAPTGLAEDWLELAVRFDAARGRWDLHVDGMAVVADIKAIATTGPDAQQLRVRGSAEAAIEFDHVFIALENRSFTDLDRDGMEDGWERAYHLDPALDDRNGDPDGDGLTNIHEFVLWTDPRAVDSDGDGLSDAMEHRLGLDPLSFTYPTDDDEDGRTQIEELQSGTDPHDFFDGRSPALTVVSEPGDPDGRLVIKVTRPDGSPWPNVPVRFALGSGTACLATNPDSTITHQDIELRSDGQGLVTVFLRRRATETNP